MTFVLQLLKRSLNNYQLYNHTVITENSQGCQINNLPWIFGIFKAMTVVLEALEREPLSYFTENEKLFQIFL